MTDNKSQVPAESKIAAGGDFRKGAQVITTAMASGFTPPSTSLNPQPSSSSGSAAGTSGSSSGADNSTSSK